MELLWAYACCKDCRQPVERMQSAAIPLVRILGAVAVRTNSVGTDPNNLFSYGCIPLWTGYWKLYLWTWIVDLGIPYLDWKLDPGTSNSPMDPGLRM